MKTQFIAWSFFIWFIGGMLGAVYEGVVVDGPAYDSLLQFSIFKQTEVNIPIVGGFSVPIPNVDYFKDLMGALTWNSAIWTGWASYIRVVILMALSFSFGLPVLMGLFGARISR